MIPAISISFIIFSQAESVITRTRMFLAAVYVANAVLATLRARVEDYGGQKMTMFLNRRIMKVDVVVVDRLMGEKGLSGEVQGRMLRINIPVRQGVRATELVNRTFADRQT